MSLDFTKVSLISEEEPSEEELYQQYLRETGQSKEPGFFGETLKRAQPTLNVLDIPESIKRTAIEAAISPEREVIPAVTEQVKRIWESPTTAASQAPSGEDILRTALPEGAIEKDSLKGTLGGIATEMAISTFPPNPFGFIAQTPKVAKMLRRPFRSASDKQATKVVAQYTSKAAESAEGVNPEEIGKFLVANDLQGEMRNPAKFFQKISGKQHFEILNPDSIDTLRVKKGIKEKGLIGQTAEEIDDVLDQVQRQYGITALEPASVGFSVLLKNVMKKMSQTSGETPDLSKIQEILEETLKPFRKEKVPQFKMEQKKIPGSLELEEVTTELPDKVKAIPTTVSLTDLQQLRKNIGKLVSTREFYKTPDKAIALETEILRDLYREIGDQIKEVLKDKKVLRGNTLVDARELYEAKNSKLKNLYNLESMLQYIPTKELKEADLAALTAGAVTKGGAIGSAALATSMLGLPQYSVPAAVGGSILGAGLSMAPKVERAVPEYLTSIFKQMENIAPYSVAPAIQAPISTFRENNRSPQSVGRFPQSVGIDPMQIAKARLPRTTEGLIQNKELLVAKLSQAGVDPEIIKTAVQALNEDPEAISNLAPMLTMQAPHIFQKSKYNMFDGVILDPEDRARAADGVSKRDDLSSIQKAKIINELNKSGKWLGE